jgi:hypothetical protein
MVPVNGQRGSHLKECSLHIIGHQVQMQAVQIMPGIYISAAVPFFPVQRMTTAVWFGLSEVGLNDRFH